MSALTTVKTLLVFVFVIVYVGMICDLFGFLLTCYWNNNSLLLVLV